MNMSFWHINTCMSYVASIFHLYKKFRLALKMNCEQDCSYVNYHNHGDNNKKIVSFALKREISNF